jgi:hypothetical protein
MNKILPFLVATLFALAGCRPSSLVEQATPTPEIFIARTQAIPGEPIVLDGVELGVTGTVLNQFFPPGCSGVAPACTSATNGGSILSVTFTPRDLPVGQFLAYKKLPEVKVLMEGGLQAASTLMTYDPLTGNLTLGFEVPADARVFGLKWAELAEIPLETTLRR